MDSGSGLRPVRNDVGGGGGARPFGEPPSPVTAPSIHRYMPQPHRLVIPGPAQREPGIHARLPDAAWIPAQACGLSGTTSAAAEGRERFGEPPGSVIAPSIHRHTPQPRRLVIPGPAQREPGIHARLPDAAWIPAQACGLSGMTSAEEEGRERFGEPPGPVIASSIPPAHVVTPPARHSGARAAGTRNPRELTGCRMDSGSALRPVRNDGGGSDGRAGPCAEPSGNTKKATSHQGRGLRTDGDVWRAIQRSSSLSLSGLSSHCLASAGGSLRSVITGHFGVSSALSSL